MTLVMRQMEKKTHFDYQRREYVLSKRYLNSQQGLDRTQTGRAKQMTFL